MAEDEGPLGRNPPAGESVLEVAEILPAPGALTPDGPTLQPPVEGLTAEEPLSVSPTPPPDDPTGEVIAKVMSALRDLPTTMYGDDGSQQAGVQPIDGVRAGMSMLCFVSGLALILIAFVGAIGQLDKIVDIVKESKEQVAWVLGTKAVLLASCIGAGLGLLRMSASFTWPLSDLMKIETIKAEAKTKPNAKADGSSGSLISVDKVGEFVERVGKTLRGIGDGDDKSD